MSSDSDDSSLDSEQKNDNHDNTVIEESVEPDVQKIHVSLWMKTSVSSDVTDIFDTTLVSLNMKAIGRIQSLWECIHFQMKRILKTAFKIDDGFTLKNIIHKKFCVAKYNDDNLLMCLIDDYKLALEIISLNKEFLAIKYGNQTSKTIQILHIGYKYFIPVIPTSIDDNFILSAKDRELLSNIKLDVIQPDDVNDSKREEEKKLMKSLSEMLQGRERAQDFIEWPKLRTGMQHYYDVFTTDQLNDDEDLKLCTLHIKNAHFGTATIISRNGEKDREISLLNRKNCGFNAFEGDIVYVKINDKDNSTGRVVGVQSSFHKPINSIYLCKISRDQGSHMLPLDGSFPKILVDNEPGRRKYESEYIYKRNKSISSAQKSVTMYKRESSRFADNIFVTIYNIKFDKKNNRANFSQRNIENVDPEMCDKLFLVFYEYWDIRFMYPRGKVVGMISTYDKFEDSLHLILPLCNIEHTVKNKSYRREINAISEKVNKVKELPWDVVPKKAIVFTVDNETTQDMDDAISYHVDGDEIVIGVHITDITRYISSTNEIYKQAMRRFATAYIPHELKIDPIYVIDKTLSTQFFSLVPNKIRAVLSIMFHFSNSNLSEPCEISLSETFIKSKYKLSYKQVERWIKAEEITDDVSEDLFLAIKDCYKIAKDIRKKRLPHSYFVRQSKGNKTIDFKFYDSFNAQFLVEEFMLMANEHVAKTIYGRYPDMSLIRIQEPVIDFEDWQRRLFEFSNQQFHASLKQYCQLLRIDRGVTNERELIVSAQYFDDFSRLLYSDIDRARNMLQYDEYINDFYVHMSEWYGISPSAKYECSLANSVDNRHFSLDMDVYTHFTSPIRRFTDVIVHKLLKSIINPSFVIDSLNECKITEVCTIANKRLKANRLFEKRCAPYAIFETLPYIYNFVLDCACSNITNEDLHFVHPSLNKISCKSTIRFAHLLLNQTPVTLGSHDTATVCDLRWKKIIYSVKPIKNETPRQVFIINNHLYDGRLSEKAHRLFLKIRHSQDTSENLRNEIMELHSKFLVCGPNVKISSDSLANPIIEIHLRLEIKNNIRIQFCSHKSNGLKRVIPELLIVDPTLQVCLIHQEDPVLCFVPGGKLDLKNSDIVWKFNSNKHYKEYFLPLLRLESLKEIMKEKSQYTFLDVRIHWMKAITVITGKEETFGIIKFDHNMFAERFIEFHEDSEDVERVYNDIIEQSLKSLTGGLVCLRGKLPTGYNYWVGHGNISLIRIFQIDKKSPIFRVLVFMLTQSDFELDDRKHAGMTFTVETYFRSISQSRQLKAVSLFDNDKFLKDVVLGRNIDSMEKADKHVQVLLEQLQLLNVPTPNRRQKQAIRKALDEKLSLIWGPPGTGKTSIGCILAYCYCLKNRGHDGVVVYCGPSNESVNIIIGAMTDKFKDECPKLLRVFSKQQELADFPLPGHVTNCKPLPVALKKYSLHFLMRELKSEVGKELRKLDDIFKIVLSATTTVRTDSINGNSVHHYVHKYKRIVKMAKEECISGNHFEMILCTTSVAGSQIKTFFNANHIIIDEAGMCKEPETLVPIFSFSKSIENVVLIGDHKQLRPIILDDLAKKRGLEISLFERYQFLRPSIVTMLNEQYRMHPSICDFPSKYFYDGELKTIISPKWSGLQSSDFPDSFSYKTWNGFDYGLAKNNYQDSLRLSSYSAIADNIWPAQKVPRPLPVGSPCQTYAERIVFIHIVGDEIVQSIATTTCSENSRANEQEVNLVGYIYDKLISRMDSSINRAEHITVLTQYRLQESLLSIKCKSVLVRHRIQSDPIVRTVIKSQGSENDYVIFSTVRSLRNPSDILQNPTPGWENKYLGFITDPNQVNVALTRARKGLIIVGNKSLLSVNEMWKKLLNSLNERHCIINSLAEFL